MLDFSCNEEAGHLLDWEIPVAFNHRRNLEKITGIEPNTQKWRVKDRVNKNVYYFLFERLFMYCYLFFLTQKRSM